MFDVVSCYFSQFTKKRASLARPQMSPFSPIHLPSAVLVVWMGSLVFVEYDHRILLRILRVMQVPVMTGIPGHNRHIIGIRGNDGEILRIQAFQIFIAKHGQTPSQQTALPAPAPQGKPSAPRSCPQNTCCR